VLSGDITITFRLWRSPKVKTRRRGGFTVIFGVSVSRARAVNDSRQMSAAAQGFGYCVAFDARPATGYSSGSLKPSWLAVNPSRW
jgi:cyanate permease